MTKPDITTQNEVHFYNPTSLSALCHSDAFSITQSNVHNLHHYAAKLQHWLLGNLSHTTFDVHLGYNNYMSMLEVK